jgi:hypothetical protein
VYHKHWLTSGIDLAAWTLALLCQNACRITRTILAPTSGSLSDSSSSETDRLTSTPNNSIPGLKMGSKSDIDQGHPVSENNTHRAATTDDTPPIYYDSEPSSQPPRSLTQHTQTQVPPTPNPSATTQPPNKPPNQHRNSAPASTIHAISPYVDLDAERRTNRKSKSLRERWKYFKERNFHDDHVGENQASGSSGPQINVMGGRL